jgi:oligosaccharide repeat unit polymerase
MAEYGMQNRYKNLFLIPSFYGSLTWAAWLFLYSIDLIRLNKCSVEAMAIFIFVEIMFIFATFVFLPFYKENPTRYKKSTKSKAALLLLHAVGFTGIAIYVYDFSLNMWGLSGFLFALQNEAAAIRMESLLTTSLGWQVTYFGWIATALTVYHYVCKRISGYWLVLAAMQYLGNFLFIDRTRPFWILLTSILLILPAARDLQLKRIVKWAVSSTLMGVMLFWAVAEWTGKTAWEGKYGDTILPGIAQEFIFYGVGGFGYFNDILQRDENISYIPERIFYPLFKFLAKLELVEDPPSQILEFHEIPYLTNVGTFLEPVYRDGGLLYLLLGIVFFSFGLNLAGYYFLKSGQPLAIYAWANLCFASLMAFFTSHLTTFPVWLFVGLGIISMIFGSSNSQRYRHITTGRGFR